MAQPECDRRRVFLPSSFVLPDFSIFYTNTSLSPTHPDREYFSSVEKRDESRRPKRIVSPLVLVSFNAYRVCALATRVSRYS